MRAVTYDLGEGDEFADIAVGVEWVEARGIAVLRRLAEAAGVIGADLYPPTCAGCGGNGSTVAMGAASECGNCGGAGVDLPERYHSPHLAEAVSSS